METTLLLAAEEGRDGCCSEVGASFSLQKTQQEFVGHDCRGVGQGLVLFPIVPGYMRQQQSFGRQSFLLA